MSSSPWTSDDLLRWGVTLILGATVSALGWFFAAGHGRVADQTVPASAGIAGLVIAGYGHAAWILRGRRAVGARTKHFLGDPPGAIEAGTKLSRWQCELLVAGPGLRRYHRADCPLAAGAGWPSAHREEHEAAGKVACGVCQP
jgi:hypothetical protein